MSKLGETKSCDMCGGTAVLRVVQPSFAILGWVDGSSFPYEVPTLLMWQCDECDERQPLDGEIED